mmetsp:Transcript_21249/g.39138  ORF Transcript_21249/g.39138 Transcript_21249/m.39138 type:complete len:371 (+) Transcript_21249:95-1207(+)
MISPSSIASPLPYRNSMSHRSMTQDDERIEQRVLRTSPMHPALEKNVRHSRVASHTETRARVAQCLQDEINQRRDNRNPWKETEFHDICLSLFKHMMTLHSQTRVHGALGTRNIYIKEGTVMLRKCLSTEPLKISSLPPETLERLPYNQETDVWGMGVVLVEMATLSPLDFVTQKDQAVIDQKLFDLLEPSRISKAFFDIILSMLRLDPSLRPTFEVLHYKLQHLKEKLAVFSSPNPSCQGGPERVPFTTEVSSILDKEFIKLKCRHPILKRDLKRQIKSTNKWSCSVCPAPIRYSYLRSLADSKIEGWLSCYHEIVQKSECPQCDKIHNLSKLEKYYFAVAISCSCGLKFCSLCRASPSFQCPYRRVLE